MWNMRFAALVGAVVLLVPAAALAAPDNDDRDTAQRIARLPLAVGGTLADAGRERDEAASPCADGGASVWYRIDPSHNRRIVARLHAAGDLDALRLRRGVRYRIALTRPGLACIGGTLHEPGATVSDEPVAMLGCKGYLLFTPRRNGTHSIVVCAARGVRGPQRSFLAAGGAGRDDSAPGVRVDNYGRIRGGLGRLDRVDLFRFDVVRRSVLFVHLQTARRTLATPALAPFGTQQIVVRTRPAIDGPVAVVVQQLDPLAGWQYVRTLRGRMIGGLAAIPFAAPTIGHWRATAEYEGTRGRAPSVTGFAEFRVVGPLHE